MLDPLKFVSLLRDIDIDFFTGVPDSLLKEFCSCVTGTFSSRQHQIVANEGAAVGLAAGYHLATKKAGLVYMQNSGTGNAINPLLSLADPEVYSIPMMVVIGWRGAPGTKDEPQHVKQGMVQEALIRSLGYPYEILSTEMDEAKQQILKLSEVMNASSTPVVVLVRKGTFGRFESSPANDNALPEMAREQALEIILDKLSDACKIVSTTGMISREIYEIRERRSQGHSQDFLTVGSMGHAGMIALGLANFQAKRTICIDGDGAVLMHMGALPHIGLFAPSSFVHILLNNGAHDSVGGQPTIGLKFSFSNIAKECGYKKVITAKNADELQNVLPDLDASNGPYFVEAFVRKGARPDLGRPKTTPLQNKKDFLENE